MIEIRRRNPYGPQGIDRGIADNDGHPADGRSPLRVKPRRMAPDLEIRILKNILDIAGFRTDRRARLAHLVNRESMEFGKRPVVAQRNLSHQVSEMMPANRRRAYPSSFHRFVPEADYRTGNERRLASDHRGARVGINYSERMNAISARLLAALRRRRAAAVYHRRTNGLIRRPKKPFMRRSPVIATRHTHGSSLPTKG